MIPMTRKEFNKLSAHLKYRAFTIAKVSSVDLINRVKDIYKKTLEKGKTISETLQEVKKLLPDLTARHLETHFRTNMMTSYNAGRINELKNNPAVHYLMYNAILDNRTTKLCKTLHGTVKPKDDRFWDKFYPPCHYNCRSSVYPIHKSELGEELTYTEQNDKGKIELKKIKIKPSNITEEDLYKDPQIVLEHQFRGNPEKAIYEIPDSLIDRAIKYRILEDLIKTAKNYFCKIKLSTEDECEEELKRIFVKPKESFKEFVEEVISSNFKPKGRLKPIGWIPKNLRELIKQKGLEPKTPLIVINDKRIIHSIRDAKSKRDASISLEEILQLPDILNNPRTVIFDKIHENLLYIYPSIKGDKTNKIVVEINYKLKKFKKLIDKEPELKEILEVYKDLEKINEVNIVLTMGKVSIHQIRKHIKDDEYILLIGNLD